MTRIIRLIFASWTIFTTCFAYPDVHKYMNSDQLQSIFHVDNANNVPQYELIELIHHQNSINYHHNNNRRRRSINSNSILDGKELHHVKKDLSKTPYYSDLKSQSQSYNGNSISYSEQLINQKKLNYSKLIKNLDLSQIKEHNVSFSAFGEVHNLTLKPAHGLFKNGPNSLRMWMVRNEPNSTNELNYDEIHQKEDNIDKEDVGEVFQDEGNMAAILMRRHLETGDLMMEGSIGHEMVIKPLPHELSPDQSRTTTHHIIYKREIDNSDHLSDFAYMEPDQFEHNENENVENFDSFESRIKRGSPQSSLNRRKRRAAPYMIYPEILVIVDYDGYRLHGGDNVQVKRYFVSFWNGVDLRYRLLKGPRIRISIAGIIISRGRDATPYLERNRVGRDAIDSAAALTDMGKYLFRERRLPVYDIAVAITKYDMCRRRKGGRCTKGTAGFAYVGGACVVNKRLEKVNSVAIIEDTGGFSGIIVAAHEVGHLLGAVHDGSPPPSYLGGPGAERCRWEDGYIMSDLRHTERGFRWSPCTIQSFHHFLNGDTASCLHNAPHEDAALGRSLPGTLLSLDAQCRRDRGTYACFKDDRVCAQLFCFDAQTGYCVAYRPAAEGSSCGNGSHCLDGRCVPSHSNAIQDYNHQYRSNFNSAEQDEDDESSYDDEQYSTTTTVKSTTHYTPIVITTTTTTTPPQSQTPKIIQYDDNIPKTSYNPYNFHKAFYSTTTINPTIINNPSGSKTTELTTVKRSNIPIYYNYFKRKSSTTTTTTTTTDNIQNVNYNNNDNNNDNSNDNDNANANANFNDNNFKNNKTEKPFDYYLNLFHKKDKSRSNYLYNTSLSTTTVQPIKTTTTTTTKTPIPETVIVIDDDIDNNNKYNYKTNDDLNGVKDDIDINNNDNNNKDNNYRSTPTTTQRSYILGGRSTTRSSFFESYFKKLASTTRSPYNFDNFGQFFKRSKNKNNNNNTQVQQQQQQQQQQPNPPSYTTNFLGDNSNNLPVNIFVNVSNSSSQ